MVSSRLYLSKSLSIFLAIAAVVATVVAAFAFQSGEQMINYYCVAGNPFFGIHFQNFAACPIYISICYILVITSVFFVIGLLVSILIDGIKLKTENIFQLDANEPTTRESNIPRWASIKVTNASGEILKNCFVDLEDVLDVDGKSVLQIKRKRKLLWSAGDPPRDTDKVINPEEQKVIDVATTFPDNKKVMFETQAGKESKDKGIYEVIIVVNGEMNGKPKRKRSRFSLEYSEGNVLTIINKGNEQWQNPNPQPPKTRKTSRTKNTDLHSPSS